MKIPNPLLAAILVCDAACGVHASATSTEQRYYNSDLKIEFRLPPDWEARGCPNWVKESKCIALGPRNLRAQPESSITLEVINATLEDVAHAHVLFEKTGGVWVKRGRHSEGHVIDIRGGNWVGMEAVASCSVSDETGVYAAAGECYTAILSDGKRSVVIETDGFAPTIDAAVTIKDSLRFFR